MNDIIRFCCALNRNNQLNAAGKYRHVLSIGLKGVSGSIDTYTSSIIDGARGSMCPFPGEGHLLKPRR